MKLAWMSKQKNLLHSLQAEGLPPSLILEILHAASGTKVSRTTLPDKTLLMIVPMLERHGLHVGLSRGKHYVAPDQGKGGWCNRASIGVPSDSPLGEHMIYVGTDPARVFDAMACEERGDDAGFAGQLSIPECCVAHYVTHIQEAAMLQNDLTIFSYRNTKMPCALSSKANSVSQYFGHGILGFFPCSFECSRAAEHAQLAMQMLSKIDAGLAAQFIENQQGVFVYTEYDGIYRISRYEHCGEWITYDPTSLEGTLHGSVHSCLARGNQIQVYGRHGFRVFGPNGLVLDLEHPLAAVMIFDGEWLHD